MSCKKLYALIILATLQFACNAQQANTSFNLFKDGKLPCIVYDSKGTSLDSISANLLADDIKLVTGTRPVVKGSGKKITGCSAVLIGNINSAFIKKYSNINLPSGFANQKESFYHSVSEGRKAREQYFIIAGTDARGTAYGVFNISEKIGVSPWHWWADVPVKKQSELILPVATYFSQQPTVEYRGIFLNDEDWGLQPWAAKTFEPETGDIGPKTYAKIFELLLRLKANTIWPAMHPSTKAFFYYKGNPDMARKYHIVLGTSHAEPMLRNNVDEWKKEFGDFNYKTNKNKVYDYWQQRVKEAKGLEAIYTMGMRGVHDSGMEGVSGNTEAADVLRNVLKDQRAMFQQGLGIAPEKVPQAFTLYKEVLQLYDEGLNLPDDITLVWTDDNYGYIRRLSTPEEQKRAGGAGVYYHISYWGRPHDNLWLCSTPPALIREEMLKAYYNKANKMWIVNVGDIKPAEYETQLFLDMAYNIKPFLAQDYLNKHKLEFYSGIFGNDKAQAIAGIKDEYYKLAYERKPEYMGWSRTEPSTQPTATAYTPFDFGDEITNRLTAYDALGKKSDSIYKTIAPQAKDAFYQLVHYPVKGAQYMNRKHLYRDLTDKYAPMSRLVSEKYASQSVSAYDSIVTITYQYNNMAGGKWKHIMDSEPRDLPAFHKPRFIETKESGSNNAAGFFIEGNAALALPAFYKGFDNRYYVDVYLKKEATVTWSLKNLPDWLKASQLNGELNPNVSVKQRIWFTADWAKHNNQATDTITLVLDGKNYKISVSTRQYESASKHCFFEQNGFAVAYANHYHSRMETVTHKWQVLHNLGYTGRLMQTIPLNEKPLDTLDLSKYHPKLTYNFYTETVTQNAELIIAALPTHPITKNHKVRIGVQWDNQPVQVINFQTYDREEKWKQNVLANLATATLPLDIDKNHDHTLTLYMIDEGVCLDFIYLKTKAGNLPYALLPETALPPVTNTSKP